MCDILQNMPFDFGTANKNQKEAIQTTDGTVLIIAGPGTGKTFTLVKRAVYLITEKSVKPENIMIATFTEKAAKELITRITNELIKLDITVNVNELYIGTIHSICLRLIKENLEYTRLKKSYRLLDEFEQKYLIFRNIKKFDNLPDIHKLYGNIKNAWKKADELSFYINAISEELVTTNKLLSHGSSEMAAIAQVKTLYDELLEAENALDFSSIQSIAYSLLTENSEICKKIQETVQYIMIDEYQDTNYVQEQLVFLIGKKHNNICVVGDDDQGLYRFRGATIRNILEFPDYFPSCKKITLNENYRSEKDIVNFYNNWMNNTEGRGFKFEWDKYRFKKNILPSKEKFITDTPTVIKVGGATCREASRAETNWNQNVLDFITKLKSSGKITDYNQIAFLFRSVKNPHVKALADFLENSGVPVYSPRSSLFFDRQEIRFLIAALIMCFPDFLTRLNKGELRASSEMIEYYTNCIKDFYEYLSENKNDELLKFIKFRARDHASPSKNFDYAFTGLMYRLLQYEPFKSYMSLEIAGVTDTRPLRNLAIFTNLTAQYEYLQHITIFSSKGIHQEVDYFFTMYMYFLMDGGITEYEDDSEYAPSGCVSFMTIHQSKGLEFPVVIVGSLHSRPDPRNFELLEILENEIYHRKPYEPFDLIKLFDFWRLYYTAFSRAQNLLVLTSRETGGSWADPSKYFETPYNILPNYFDPIVYFENYNFEKIKDVNIKESYSFTSHISVYENCALQYKYFNELGFIPVRTGSTLFGTLVHQTIEDIHRAALRKEESTIIPDNIKTWFDNNYLNLSHREHMFLAPHIKDAALKQVLSYADKQNGDWEKVLQAEVEVSHVEPDYILKGKIDLISGDGNTVEIIDFKAEKKPDMIEGKQNIDRYHRQLQLYSYIVERKFNVSVSKMHIYFTAETEGVPTISFDNRASEMTKTIMALDKTVKQIQCKNFKANAASPKLCKGCDVRYYCGRV